MSYKNTLVARKLHSDWVCNIYNCSRLEQMKCIKVPIGDLCIKLRLHAPYQIHKSYIHAHVVNGIQNNHYVYILYSANNLYLLHFCIL